MNVAGAGLRGAQLPEVFRPKKKTATPNHPEQVCTKVHGRPLMQTAAMESRVVPPTT
jgi:hypothetical protein